MSNQYLIADTPTDYAELQGLYFQMESGGGMMMNSLEFPGEGDTNGGGGGSWEYTPIVYGSNDLWLEVVQGSVTNGMANLVIHNPASLTNDVTWYVWGTTNLSFCQSPWAWDVDNWTWLAVAEPGETNLTVPQLSEVTSFYRLADPANDADGDGITDYYSWLHFGHPLGWSHDLSRAMDDYDGDGYDNGTEYTNNTNPNDIAFTVRFTDEFANQTNVIGTCVVSSGAPYEMAVLVNSTNFAAATWLPYASSFAASIGPTDAVYTVRVALRGRSSEFPPVRDEAQLILDRVAPVLAVTNPIGTTVIKPYLQLQGWANEPLCTLYYNLSNAFGLATNMSAAVVDEAFDTNSFDFTTNWFQAYDVPLATNLNHIFLSVTDRAGNVMSTNLVVTLSYAEATNAPVTQLLWPTNGLTIAGTNMTLRGQINDETASVSVSWVSSGETNYWPGVVERDGQFWIEQLPLNAGTNQLTLRAVDAAGNVSESSFAAIRGSLTVSLGTTPDLYESSGTVSGTVSDPGASVSVNGVAATVDEYGQWSADNVPLYGSGMSVFDLTATPPSGPAEHITYTLEKPARIRVVKHYMKQGVSSVNWDRSWIKSYRAWDETGANGLLRHKYQGTASDYENFYWYPAVLTDYAWSDTNSVGTYQVNGGYGGPMKENHWLVKSVPDQQVDHEESDVHGTARYLVEHFYARGVRHEWPAGGGTAVETLEARTKLRLYTGGKAVVGRMSLFSVQSEVREYEKPFIYEWYYTPEEIVGHERVSINGERVDAQGKIWRVLAANSTMDVNIKSDGSQHYKTTTDLTEHHLKILAHGVALDTDKVASGAEFCVGQNVPFSLSGVPDDAIATNFVWVLQGNFVNESNQVCSVCSVNYTNNGDLLKNAVITNCWWTSGRFSPSTTYVATVYCELVFTNGNSTGHVSTKGQFKMHRPEVYGYEAGEDPYAIVDDDILSIVPGAEFKADIRSAFDGQAGVTQLMTGYYTNGYYGLKMLAADTIDNAEFNAGEVPVNANAEATATNNRVRLSDEPKLGCVGQTEVHYNFTDYVRFKPTGADSIFVTLGKVQWHIYATAVPYQSSYAVFGYPDGDIDEDCAPSEEFPEWTHFFTNH